MRQEAALKERSGLRRIGHPPWRSYRKRAVPGQRAAPETSQSEGCNGINRIRSSATASTLSCNRPTQPKQYAAPIGKQVDHRSPVRHRRRGLIGRTGPCGKRHPRPDRRWRCWSRSSPGKARRAAIGRSLFRAPGRAAPGNGAAPGLAVASAPPRRWRVSHATRSGRWQSTGPWRWAGRQECHRVTATARRSRSAAKVPPSNNRAMARFGMTRVDPSIPQG